jgi:hypothetical protein
MSKIKIDRGDVARMLLTEMLPYEVPMLFSNEGFYTIVRNNQYIEFEKILNDKMQVYGIPFNYQISKSNDGDTRTLSVIHPFNQYAFMDFYHKYDSIIIHLCSKSPVSLRKIKRVAKYSFSPDLVFDEDLHHTREVEVEPDVLDVESKIFKSYFIYEPVDLIYKFYERNEYQRLEQRFNFLWEFDISKCFYHIYTHSITWAIKDKETAKRNRNMTTFENEFDKLMQRANYNETNGILVGPEISRIFAEILLQQVDLNVLNKLEENNIKFGLDYEIRRYVDDFFVFSNEQRHLEFIFKTYQKELESYKLYINSNKTKKSSTPLITDITVAKRQVKKLVKELFKERIQYSETNAMEPIVKPYYIAQNFIKDFQSIVKQNNVGYESVNKDVVRLFKSELVKIFKRNNLDELNANFEGFLLMFLDVVFYCYSLNINASVTFKIAQIIVLVIKYLRGVKDDLKHTIFTKISREAEFVMTTYHRKLKYKETNIEILNLIIPLKLMGEGYFITESKIREYFDLVYKSDDIPSIKVKSFIKLNYFQLITLLYYFSDHNQYRIIKELTEKAVVKKFQLENFPFNKAEFTCLFFDFIACPFVSIESKRKVIRHSKYETGDALKVEEAINRINIPKKWFMDWAPEIDLEKVLKKKEWSLAY